LLRRVGASEKAAFERLPIKRFAQNVEKADGSLFEAGLSIAQRASN